MIYANSTSWYSVIGKNWWEKQQQILKLHFFVFYKNTLCCTQRCCISGMLWNFMWLMSYVISEEERKRDNFTVCADYWITFEGTEYHCWLCSSSPDEKKAWKISGFKVCQKKICTIYNQVKIVFGAFLQWVRETGNCAILNVLHDSYTQQDSASQLFKSNLVSEEILGSKLQSTYMHQVAQGVGRNTSAALWHIWFGWQKCAVIALFLSVLLSTRFFTR